MKPMPKTRRYDIGDPEMLAAARRFYSRLAKLILRFFNFDPEAFPPEYLEMFKTVIQNASDISSDQVYIDMQAKETQDVIQKMKECLDALRFNRYYVKKAFDGDQCRVDQFGYNDLAEARKNVDKLIRLMRDFVTQNEKYRDKLTAAGMPQERQERMSELHQELIKEANEQDDMIDLRHEKALDRVDALNEVWDHMVVINDVAGYIFYEEPELLELFRLPTAE